MKTECSCTRATSLGLLASLHPAPWPAKTSDLTGIAVGGFDIRIDTAVAYAFSLGFGGPITLIGAGPAPIAT